MQPVLNNHFFKLDDMRSIVAADLKCFTCHSHSETSHFKEPGFLGPCDTVLLSVIMVYLPGSHLHRNVVLWHTLYLHFEEQYSQLYLMFIHRHWEPKSTDFLVLKIKSDSSRSEKKFCVTYLLSSIESTCNARSNLAVTPAVATHSRFCL